MLLIVVIIVVICVFIFFEFVHDGLLMCYFVKCLIVIIGDKYQAVIGIKNALSVSFSILPEWLHLYQGNNQVVFCI